MLAAAVSDFLGAGVQVFTTIDARTDVPCDGAAVTKVSPGDAIEPLFDRLAVNCDMVLVIAPESEGVLEQWVARLKRLNVRSLGCGTRAVNLCADKLKLACYLAQQGLPVPATALFRHGQNARFPAVVKPRRGAGCQDTYLCMDQRDTQGLPANGDWIIQPWVNWNGGVTASVSLLIHAQHVTPLLAGRQQIKVDHSCPPRLYYEGGLMPLEEPLHDRAMNLARWAASTVRGLHGFVGVDLILTEQPVGDNVIEINPRLTISYVVLQQFCKTHLASAMLANDPAVDLASAQEVRRAWSGQHLEFDAAGHVAQSRTAN